MSLFDNVFILVCNGAEFKAVNKGFNSKLINKKIIGLPIGINPVNQHLKSINNSEKSVLLIGLGGSLSPQYKVGDVVIYESSSYFNNEQKLEVKECDRTLNNWLKNTLNVPVVKGITTDKLINSSTEKANLNRWGDVVDMESFAVMSNFNRVSVVRVISDNYDDNLPDLNKVITEEGTLNNFKMSLTFIQEPLKAITLIKNALFSLKKLEKISQRIADNSHF
jgi:nucleoside phosphorylase